MASSSENWRESPDLARREAGPPRISSGVDDDLIDIGFVGLGGRDGLSLPYRGS